MQDYRIVVPLGVGDFDTQVELTGHYAELNPRADDGMRCGILANFTLMSHWIQVRRDTVGMDDTSTDATDATASAANGNGTIKVQLNVKDQREAVPADLLQRLANGIAATVQNHGDSAITNLPATNELFVQIQHYLTTLDDQRPLVGSGAGSGSRHH